MLGFKLANEAELRRAHDYFLAEQSRIIGDELDRAGRAGVEYSEQHPEFTPRSPRGLQKSNRYRVVRTSGGRLVRLTNTKDYAAAIDQGASPHVITARSKPYLHFRGSKGWVRVKNVNHPGNRPFRFLYNAHDAANRVFGASLRRRLAALAAKF